ncbi:MAG: hypothetical protein M0P33_01835 [Massilibacteroides sp.]|nr:hypothetical protein [Massilibacteroides sp.]
MKVVFKTLLIAAVIVMGYICYRSIMGPIEFKQAKDAREKAIIARLIDIRKAQVEYKNVHKTHAANFAELESFLNEEKLPFLIKEGVLTDDQLEDGMTEKEAVKKGIIRRDTFWVTAKDTLFGKNYDVDHLGDVPLVQNLKFDMDTATLTSGSGYTVKVFECKVAFNDFLKGLNPQLVYNMVDKAKKLDRFPGLRVGSLTEINNNAGNWED